MRISGWEVVSALLDLIRVDADGIAFPSAFSCVDRMWERDVSLLGCRRSVGRSYPHVAEEHFAVITERSHH
jgi:hypothetical protein